MWNYEQSKHFFLYVALFSGYFITAAGDILYANCKKILIFHFWSKGEQASTDGFCHDVLPPTNQKHKNQLTTD